MWWWRRSILRPPCESEALAPWNDPEGFLRIGVLGRARLECIAEEFRSVILAAPTGFHATSAHASRRDAQTVDRRLKALLRSDIEHLLPGHSPFLAAIITKSPESNSVVSFHQDWTYTDERSHRAVLVWIPLVDTSAANGGLRAIPGSHRWTSGLRPGGGTLPTEPHQGAFGAIASELELEAGEALIYDPALVHGSGPNPSAHHRPALAVACAPDDARLVHGHVDVDGSLTLHTIASSYYTRFDFASMPPSQGQVPWAPAVTADDFVPHLVGQAS